MSGTIKAKQQTFFVLGIQHNLFAINTDFFKPNPEVTIQRATGNFPDG